MDNGELLASHQDGGENFQPGERVRLLQDGGTTRVTR
jgi:outer membrane lipoprotein SlyB